MSDTENSTPIATTTDEQMVTITKKHYEELMRVNDAAYITVMAALDKFDEIMGMAMNLNSIVYNKKIELRNLIGMKSNNNNNSNASDNTQEPSTNQKKQ